MAEDELVLSSVVPCGGLDMGLRKYLHTWIEFIKPEASADGLNRRGNRRSLHPTGSIPGKLALDIWLEADGDCEFRG